MPVVERTNISKYAAYLKDKYRPPSKGGNTKAWHQHVVTIGSEAYSFLALGSAKWIYATDTVQFEWQWDESNRYKNIKRETIKTWDKTGVAVVRGNRDSKKWRTASARMPASRREQRD